MQNKIPIGSKKQSKRDRKAIKTEVKAPQKDYMQQESNTEIPTTRENPFDLTDILSIRPLDRCKLSQLIK
jgi:hypothetical protein